MGAVAACVFLAACIGLGALLGAVEIGRRTTLGVLVGACLGALAAVTVATVMSLFGLLLSIGFETAWVVASALVAAAAIGAYSRRGVDRELWERARSEARRAAPALAVAGGLCIIQAIATPIQISHGGDAGYDSHSYHLAIAGSLIQGGSLFDMPELTNWISYPAFVETQAALLGATFDSFYAASLVQLPYFVWLLIMTALCATRLGGRYSAVLAVIVVAAIPSLWLQARVLYVDLAYAAFFVGATVSAVAALQHRSRVLLLTGALFTGAMFAVKFSPTAAAPALAVTAAALAVKRLRLAAVASGVVVVAPMVPIVIRNLIEFGEPLYPLALFGKGDPSHDFESPPFTFGAMNWLIDDAQQQGLFADVGVPLVVYEYLVSPVSAFVSLARDPIGATSIQTNWSTYVYDARLGGFGVAWLLFVAVGLCAAIALLVRHRRSLAGVVHGGGAWFAVGATTISVVAAVATRAAWFPRYLFGPAVLAAVCAAIVLSRVDRRVALGITPLVAIAALLTASASERFNGLGRYGDWSAVPDGLSTWTPHYEPLVESGAERVVVVGERPRFAGELWVPDFDTHVSISSLAGLDVDCASAYLVTPADEAEVRRQLAREVCGDYHRTQVVEPRRIEGAVHVWLIRAPE